MKRKILILYILLVFVASFLGTSLLVQRTMAQTQATGGSTTWPLFQGIIQHSGFNGYETILNTASAPHLRLLWSRQVGGAIASQVTSTNGLIYWASWDGYEHASNPSTGADVWATNVGTTAAPGCIPTSAGPSGAAAVTLVPINGVSTPVAFVSGGNATFYALNANTGAVLWSRRLGTSPSHMMWAGPIVYRGSVYVGVSSFGDCPLVQGQMVQMQASSGMIQHLFNAVPNGCVGAGIWDTPTIDPATNTLYVSTGTEASCSHAGNNLAMGLLSLRATDLKFLGSWIVPRAQAPGDSDFGSTPTLFTTTIGGVVRQMIGLMNKNGIYYAFDRGHINLGPLWQFQLSVGVASWGGNNFSSSGWDGSRLYVAGGGSVINGTRCLGGLRALNPATGQPIWQDCLGADVYGSIMVVHGVVVVGAGTQMVAVDSATGKLLFTFQDNSTGSQFVASATIINGRLYLGNEDGKLYAFGL